MSVWLLPENIADMLPREARVIEAMRSSFLSLVTSHGFEIVRPPLVEYVDSLLTGTGGDLDLRTFKIVDQVSGRTMGIRADMTPQVARIDAHILNREGVSRLCYVGSVLHARPLHPMASRQPYVAGVELFGSTSAYSDKEVICLGLEALRTFNIQNIMLDLGHTGVVKAILDKDPASGSVQDQILFALSHKDRTSIEEFRGVLQDRTVDALLKLAVMFGDESVLDKIAEEFYDYPEILPILDHVRWLGRMSGADGVSYDFADVHGYQYLTGVTYSVNIPGRYQAVLRGGRYDDIGARFGRRRPAVGFTLYLREIVAVMDTRRPYAILAPINDEDPLLNAKIKELRSKGLIVVQSLPEDSIESLEEAYRLDEELLFVDGTWTVTERSVGRRI